MSPREELYAAADDMADFAARNPLIVGVHATSPKALAFRPQLGMDWFDKSLNEHLAAGDRAESFEAQVRENVSDDHICKAFELVRSRKDLTAADKALLDLIAEQAFEIALEEAQ